MAVLSVLRAAGISIRGIVGRSSALVPKNVSNTISKRGMAGHRKMIMLPTRFEWTQWKDDFHFYVALGLIPIGILVTVVNIFIGPAELADIPEDYEPKHWEYYRHPIQRWFARYVYDSPQKGYEKQLHYIANTQRNVDEKKLERKVKDLMADRGDYKGWYYVPVDDQHTYAAYKADEELKSGQGTGPV